MRFHIVWGSLFSLFSLLWSAPLFAEPEPLMMPLPRMVLSTDLSLNYHSFYDAEPSTSDKSYSATSVFGFAVGAELYPWSRPMRFAPGDLGFTLGYARAVGLTSVDRDTRQRTDTEWHRVMAGIRYRIHPFGPLERYSGSLSLGVEDSVFDFEKTADMVGLVPLSRYVLLSAGFLARMTVGKFAFSLGGQALYPLSKAAPGDRTPESFGMGVRALGSVLYPFSERAEFEAGATYTMVTYGLLPVAGREDTNGRVLDQSFALFAGPRFWF